MLRPRVIPVLLLSNKGLVKSVAFNNHRYIGDPINAVRIFNNFHADELVFLDIDASKHKKLISLDFVKDVGEEANMPFAVGGGIRSINEIRSIINAGAEKVVINTYALENPDFIKEASKTFGSTTICVCIDVKRNILGKDNTYILGGSKSVKYTPIEVACLMEENGAGEIIVQSINHDGRMRGYDIELIKSISRAVTIPVVALGGAGSLEDLKAVYKNGNATALAAGSMFVYQGSRKAVLINYPSFEELMTIVEK